MVPYGKQSVTRVTRETTFQRLLDRVFRICDFWRNVSLYVSRDVRQYPEPASRARPYFNQHRRVASRVPRSTASRELTSGLGCIPSAHARLGETRGALEAGARDRGPAKFAAKR